MGFLLKEHVAGHIICKEDVDVDHYAFDADKHTLTLSTSKFTDYANLRSREFKVGQYCYQVSHVPANNRIVLQPGYFIGVDWLIEGVRHIHIEPKINKKTADFFDKQLAVAEDDKAAKIEEEAQRELQYSTKNYAEINYLKMLLDAMSDSTVAAECVGLVRIDWDATRIKIQQQDDRLTPFLVVQFLQLLRQIVRKGLKKSYYKVQENLNSRVKGKILVGQQLRQNVMKHRLTKTYCAYQVFGEDNVENRFLKKVLLFSANYVENNTRLFAGNKGAIQHLINYARPAFEQISNDIGEEQLRHIKHNPFFKEYRQAIQIGQYILKQFSYNITRTTEYLTETPPFWIDMPRLFELYVYQKLLQDNAHDKDKIRYQFSTYGNALDILVKDGDNSMIIDAKYKLHYSHSHVHQDIRQVAGYARLNRVRTELDISDDRNIDCLIIYPDMEHGIDLDEAQAGDKKFSLAAITQSFGDKKNKIHAYHKVYKVGVKLPELV